MNLKEPSKKKLTERYDFLFLAGFGATFLVTLIIFTIFGLIPKEISPVPVNNNFTLESQSKTSLFGVDFTKSTNEVHKINIISNDSLPVRIVIPSIGVDTKIVNPESTNISLLDNELSKAPVRYPGSGTLSSGNIFIFGHSTSFSVVHNPAYKVFNGIKTLKVGDNIIVYALSGRNYNYSVTNVREVNKYDTKIDFSSDKPSLTLSTCDSFGQPTDRFVVSAVLRP